MTKCKRCQELEKDWPEVQKHGGVTVVRDELQCAFVGLDKFSSENWNCGTMLALRRLGEPQRHGDSQQSYTAIPFYLEHGPDNPCSSELCILTVTWYKERGQTENAGVIGDHGTFTALTLTIAEQVLKQCSPR